MNEENRNIITSNCHFLAENTSNLPVLLTLLQETEILGTVEQQTISSKNTDYEKCLELYSTVVKKGNESLEILLNCLKNSGNKAVAIKIQGQIGNNRITKLIWFNIRPVTTFFKGRDEEMSIIQNSWENTRKNNSLKFVAITGLGGVGKSELARKFTKWFYLEATGHCIWINAESNRTIFVSFQKLANKLGICLTDGSGKEIFIQSLAYEIYEQVCRDRCLFIIDNAENIEVYESSVLKSLVEFSNELPPDKIRPFGLLTSRCKIVNQILGSLATHIQLNVLSEEAAISFFMAALNIVYEDMEMFYLLRYICRKLKCFPLAMQQAVAYIKMQTGNPDYDAKVGIVSYLEAFDKETKKLLDFPLPKLQVLDDVSKTTYVTWQITINTLGKKSSDPLNIIAFFHSDNIDVEFATEIINMIHPELKNSATIKFGIFDLLDEYSMCQLRRKSDITTLSIHRLVQKVIRIRLEEEGTFYNLLETLLEAISTLLLSGKVKLNNMIHIETIWEHMAKQKKLMEKYANLGPLIVNEYIDAGKYSGALQFSRAALTNLVSLFGKEHKQTLIMMCLKGKVIEHLVEFASTLTLLEETFANGKRMIEKIKNTIITEGEIGVIRLSLKRQSARMLKEHFGHVWGKEVEDTIALKHELALAFSYQGKYEESLVILKNELTFRERQSGKENPQTLSTMTDIGLVLSRQKKFEDALKIFTEAFKIRKRVFGKQHQDTLSNMGNMASSLVGLGKLGNAMKMHEDILAVQERILEKYHLDTLTTMNNIGYILDKLEKHTEAVNIFKEILPVRIEKLGKEHPDTLITMNNVGCALLGQGKNKEASVILEDVLKVRESILQYKLDHGSYKKGFQAEILSSLKGVVEASVRVLGIKHPSTLHYMNTLSSLLHQHGKHEEALKMEKFVFQNS